jgi:ethanolamine utilization microcompartment shell protein EutL
VVITVDVLEGSSGSLGAGFVVTPSVGEVVGVVGGSTESVP